MKCISLNVKPLFNIFLIHMHSSKILKSSWGYQVYCVPCLKPGLLSKLGWRIRFLQHQIDVVTYSKCMKMSDITFFFSLHQKLCFALFVVSTICVFLWAACFSVMCFFWFVCQQVRHHFTSTLSDVHHCQEVHMSTWMDASHDTTVDVPILRKSLFIGLSSRVLLFILTNLSVNVWIWTVWDGM